MTEMKELSYVDAIIEGIAEEMAVDPKIFHMSTEAPRRLQEEFGFPRVRQTPIAESALTGMAIGAAAGGYRPIVDWRLVTFCFVAMDQIVNQAAKIHYMFGGQTRFPLVFRTTVGGGTRRAAQHSQSLEAWFAHVPGLKVVMPSSPADAKGLLLSALDDPNPVIVLEHKLLYKTSGPVPEEMYRTPIGVSNVVREGKDLTIVATGVMVSRSLEAAAELASQGIEATVIDVRTLSPLDMGPIEKSIAETGRVMLVQEAPKHVGFMAEIAARISEGPALYHLTEPVKRLCGLDVPIPYAPQLEKSVVPQLPGIIAGAQEVMRGV